MSILFPESPPNSPDRLKGHVDSLMDRVSDEFKHDCDAVIGIWSDTWEHEEWTPEQIFSKLGTAGYRLLQHGAQQVDHIVTTAQNVGIDLTELLPEKYRTVKYPISISGDGVVSIQRPE